MEKRREFLKTVFGFLAGVIFFISPFFKMIKMAYGKAEKIILPKDSDREEIIHRDFNLLDTRITQDSYHYFAYSLTKKALEAFTRMAARELGPRIRVNGVAPGLILPSADTEKEAFARMGERIPLKSTGKPEDVASAVLFLLENPFITGECVFVDGGEKLL